MTRDEFEAKVWESVRRHGRHGNDAQTAGEIFAASGAFAVSYAKTAPVAENPSVSVTFDLSDPAVRHALTQALEDYADRQQTMAAIGDIPDTRLTWASHAKTMREQAEAAGS